VLREYASGFGFVRTPSRSSFAKRPPQYFHVKFNGIRNVLFHSRQIVAHTSDQREKS
jgi:hypothetical protein